MSPLLLGHRGALASPPVAENTLESFDLSLQQGCDGFEFDVRRSGDGVAVICHDSVLRGLAIERTLAADLELPTLAEVLGRFASRAFLDIELKTLGLESQALESLRQHPPQKGYVLSSFLPETLTTIHELDPTVPLGFIFDQQEQLAGWRESPAEWVIPHFEFATSELIHDVHGAGKKVMVWTVNRPEAIRTFVEWGVDAIISDQTELLVQVARANRDT